MIFMREKAKKILQVLRFKDKVLSEAFNSYVDKLTESLEIPRDIAVKIVTDELVLEYEKKLILSELFSQSTLDLLNAKSEE